MVDTKFFGGSLLKKLAGILVFAGMIAFFSIRFYSTNISSFPAHIHAWAQADRYALALGFQQNGFDLFHPQTFNVEPQFPATDSLKVKTGITQVDCPIHEYIIAIIMTAIGNNSPMVFRWYNLLYGILGFFFLFLLVRNNTTSQIKSFAAVLFALLSPVLLFYLDGFLPSTTSLASALIGYYFYFSYRNNKLTRNLMFAVLFATLAALSRTPFALFLGAMFCQLLFDMFKNKKADIKILSTFLVAFGLLLGYFIYNRMLAKAYGSVFLMHLMPVSSFAELKENLVFIYQNWSTSYFTVFHYITLLLFGFAFLAQRIRKQKMSAFQKSLFFQIVITLSVSFLYFILMIRQFHSHDYYFLDSFYIPVVLLFILFLDTLEMKSSISMVLTTVFILVFTWFSYGKCSQDMQSRYSIDPNSRSYCEVTNFTDSGKYLDSLGVGKDAIIMVFDAYSANIPLILMDRKGYAVVGTDKENLSRFLAKPFDYVAMQNESVLAEVVNFYPDIIHELEPIGNNGKISVFKKLHRKKSMAEFLQIKDDILYCRSSCNMVNDSCSNLLMEDISCDSTLSVNNTSEFADVIELDLSQYKNKKLFLLFSADCKLNLFNHDNTDLVATINKDSQQIYYKSFALNQYLGNEVSANFRKLYFMYPLRFEGGGKISLKLYIWNNGKNAIELKNLVIAILGRPL